LDRNSVAADLVFVCPPETPAFTIAFERVISSRTSSRRHIIDEIRRKLALVHFQGNRVS
jgi:hypothetical protein